MSLLRAMTRADAEREALKTQGESHGLKISDIQEQPVMLALASRIDRAWMENSRIKDPIEQELLQCLRDRKGVYSAQEYHLIYEQGSSDIFMKLPQIKVRAAEAHIRAILLPADDMAFAIEPTPVQELPPFMQEAIFKRVQQTGQRVSEQGQPLDMIQAKDKLDRMVRAEMESQGKAAAGRMNKKIEDQLVEGGWEEAMSDYVSDFATFQTALFKGPVFENRPRKRYVRTPEGIKIERKIERQMVFKTISPFDAYPGPNAETAQDGNFIERLRLSRAELYGMQNLPGYSNQAIQDVLIEHGAKGLRQWCWTDQQRAHLENKDYFWMHTADDQIDALHFWGRAQGRELLEWGMSAKEITDPLAEYEIDAIKIGRHIIRANINHDPEFRRPIHVASYEKVPGSFWGNSISFLMRDITRMCNGVARNLQNNISHAAGAQVEINYDRIASETDVFAIHPWKIWQSASSEYGANDPAVKFFQPTSNANELMYVYNEFLPQADDATGIPRFAHANDNVGGAGDTARGLSMLMDSSARLLRLSISNIDTGVIKQVVSMVFDYNMEHDPDPSIKGDAQVVAKGANALLQRESAREAQMTLLELTANDIDMGIIGPEGRAKILRELINTYPSISKSVVPDEESLAEQIAQQAQQPDPEMLKLQSEQEQLMAKLEVDRELEMKRLASREKTEADRLETQKMTVDAEGEYDLQKEELAQKYKLQIEQAKMADNRSSRVADRVDKQMESEDSRMDEAEVKELVKDAIEPLLKKIEQLNQKIVMQNKKQ